VPPGKLLGEDGLERPAGEAEMALIRVIRQLNLAPEDVLAMLVPAPEPLQPDWLKRRFQR
jgi:hypothetical protein